MAIDNWTDEECRYFFQLFADEKKKGNRPKSGMNQTGKEFITKKFEERFGKKYGWQIFKNKYDSSRKAYFKFKRLVQNRTGMGYDDMGRIDMSDHWWDERVKEWDGAKKYRNRMDANVDLFEAEFGAISVTGAEGWSAQQGEASLDSRVDRENEDESDSVGIDGGIDMSVPEVEKQNKPGSSRTKRRRKEIDLATETSVARNEILAQKNKLMEQMLERETAYSVEHVLEILNQLPGVRKWSPFHRAAVDHLIAELANRQGFIAFSSVDDKISYLEHRTGKNLDDDF